MTTYEVKIERRYVKERIDLWIQGCYWWDVDVYLDGKYTYALRSYGWAKSEASAKSKALKHIYHVESKVPNEFFGVIIKAEGSAEMVTEVLK